MQTTNIIGLVFAIISTIILAYLFKSGKFTRRTGYVFIMISILLGFILFAPMLPLQLQGFLLGDSPDDVPLPIAIFGLLIFIILSLVVGRFLCGYLCPIGAIQELAYSIPTKKFKLDQHRKTLMGFRFLLLAVIILAALVFEMSILGFLGPGNFYTLAFATISFWIFIVFLVTSIFIYRPFCRLACPYGALLSLVSGKSKFKLSRNDKCISCKKCEKVCPTGEAFADASKAECYLCFRCVESCPVDAIDYGKK